MLNTLQSGTDNIDFLNNKYNYKVKVLGIIEVQYDAAIRFYLKSHENYYLFSFYNNNFNEPEITCEKFEDLNECIEQFKMDLDMFDVYNIYKCSSNITLTDTSIECDLFKMDLKAMEPKDILLKKSKHLDIDETLLLDKDKYIDISKEIFDSEFKTMNKDDRNI